MLPLFVAFGHLWTVFLKRRVDRRIFSERGSPGRLRHGQETKLVVVVDGVRLITKRLISLNSNFHWKALPVASAKSDNNHVIQNIPMYLHRHYCSPLYSE